MSANIVDLSQSRKTASSPKKSRKTAQVAFQRAELNQILSVYGFMVSKGEWKDYAIDFLPERAVFSIFRRATETPLYTIEKRPDMAAKQGAYSVIAPGGLILKRSRELKNVLKVFDKKRFSIAGR
ncbi:DUF2794 domain-containing protein [Robiginitomaculum antarcticum]|uniref:DUF2794 domain-containing protein n=1 Tax=Robiginitomaculum antarcticum TaxID=437507 RepID=UPI000363B68C|nr:DUF2794 domain-containing protein [Robiginitomaculum antarcticum]